MKEKGNRDAVIVSYGRTPLARAYKGAFAGVHPVDFAAQTLNGVLEKLEGFDRSLIDDVIVGCAIPEKYVGYNVGRLIAQKANLPDCVSGQTVNRFCASGLQAIETAANAIKAGEMDIIAAGGVELMTGISMTHPAEYQFDKLADEKPGTYMPMGITAENVAAQFHISRHDMDIMAAESHRKAAEAQAAGKFRDEIIPITIIKDGCTVTVTEDEGIRPGTTAADLEKLKPCFMENGSVTAATSSQMTDGASFVIIMARETAVRLGYTPIARLLSFSVSGVPAEIMGIGPVHAVPKVLKRTGLSIEDMDVIEINEAFASQSIYCIREMGFPPEKTNPNGGAIALGHPLGATGAVLTCKIISELKRTAGRYGLITLCVGGGMGAASVLELEEVKR